jgi:hypothetical protein
MKSFVRRYYKALVFSAIGLFFALHWALIQRNASPGDYIALTAMVLLSWVFDFFNGRRS